MWYLIVSDSDLRTLTYLGSRRETVPWVGLQFVFVVFPDHTHLLFKPSSKIFLLTVSKQYFFCGSFALFMYCVCHAFASVHCWLVITCWKRDDLFALVCDI